VNAKVEEEDYDDADCEHPSIQSPFLERVASIGGGRGNRHEVTPNQCHEELEHDRNARRDRGYWC